jgi:hypothetical protein
MPTRLRLAPSFGSVVLALGALTGCDGTPAPPADGLPNPPAAGQWIAIEPAGDTICSRGTDYRFFVRGGRSDRVMIDFQGGGACWDELTCGAAGALDLFSDDVGSLEEFTGWVEANGQGGYLSDDPASPFHDWTIVHIPYCTGDIHWGNTRTEYGEDLAIEHRGFVNATAALDWTYARFTNPSHVFVSGCSAGAYGAVLHSAYVANHYTSARVSVFADSGAGIITDSFLNDSLPNWNAQPNLPSFVPGLDVPLTELSLADLYIRIGQRFPAMRLAQTNTNYDQDQVFFYTAMGGMAADWPLEMRASHDRIATATNNFTSYVPGGSVHCAGIYPILQERTVSGVALVDWAEQLATGETMPERVVCEGASCCDDAVCEECAATPEAERATYCQFCRDWPTAWPECSGT